MHRLPSERRHQQTARFLEITLMTARLRLLSVSLRCLLTLTSLSAVAQLPTPASALIQSFDQYRRQSLQEKLFVHTDQSVYLTGELIWFKIYYVDGTFHQPLDLSKVTYLELLDKDGKPALQTKVALTANGGNGSLFVPASLNSGTYLMRAYTSWMKNVGADFYFEKALTIVNPFRPLGLPVLTETPRHTIELFPEGGQLVQGLPGNVAFRVTDASGRGVAARGWLLSNTNDTLARFSTHKFGIGTFPVTPAINSNYRVVLRDDKGVVSSQPLPVAQAKGYAMHVSEEGNSRLKITVATTIEGASEVYLFAHTRNDIKVAERRAIQGETAFLVDKKALGDGISHLTIFDANRQPVCERLYFKRPDQPLAIELKTNQNQYAPRATVTLSAAVQAAGSKTGEASLSVAVYRVDSLVTASTENILSYLWLTADLRGDIESPTYYLQPETPEQTKAADNLMLTHGWRRFRWNDVLSGKPVNRLFIPEHNRLIVQGTVTNPATGAPVSDVLTYLTPPGKPVRLYANRSNSAGQIRFELDDFYGPKYLIVQTNPQDSLYTISITNPFSETLSGSRLPAFSVSESMADVVVNRSVAMQVRSSFGDIRRPGDPASQFRVPTVDSTAFYGVPGESYKLDVYTRFPRMEEVLREYVRGVAPRKRQGRFRLFVPNSPYEGTFFEEPSLVLIDGVPIFNIDRLIEFSPLKISQLDVITNQYLLGANPFPGVISFMTYKGDLAGFSLDNKTLKLDYDGLQLQREFYAPRYDNANQQTSRLPDARTLLYWNPDVKPDAQGNAQLTFSTSDQTGTYLIEVNGLTTQGQAGSQQRLFTVKNPPK
ncbi:hypothetical protein [Fibrella aquatica]|uniref:hypothetical protein n=1 Tax=Fibrella aquatica TaxID=3242487 RepID=UPI0035216E96